MTNREISDESPALEADGSQSVPASLPRQISSTDLFSGENEILIQHADELYRLRLTRNGKLILHK